MQDKPICDVRNIQPLTFLAQTFESSRARPQLSRIDNCEIKPALRRLEVIACSLRPRFVIQKN